MSPKNALSGASLLAVAILCCAASAARAAEKYELRGEVLVEQAYDSNVFYNDKDPHDSALTTIRPSLNLENHSSLGLMRLYGYLADHIFWSESKLNGIDRGFGADLQRRIFPRTTLFGNGSYQRLAAHLEVRGSQTVTTTPSQGGIPGETIVQPGELIEAATPDTDLAQGVFGVRQDLTPRTQLSLSGGPFMIDYLEDNTGLNALRDRSGWYTRLELEHVLTPLDYLTVDLTTSGTELSDAFSGPIPVDDPSDPHTVNINTGKTESNQQALTIGWSRSWTEHWNSSVAIGVRRLHTQTTDALRPLTRISVSGQGVIPFRDFVPVEFSDTSPGVIGQVSLTRQLPRGQVGFSYVRETRTTSSLFAADVDVDTVSLGWTHRLSSLVRLTLSGTYEHYESVNNNAQFFPAGYQQGSFNPITGPEYVCPIGSLIEAGSGAGKTGQCRFDERTALQSDGWTAVARVDWQLQRRLSTFLVFRYGDRNGDEALFGEDYDKFNVGVGFKYDYALGL